MGSYVAEQHLLDLRSDTVTQPSLEMRRAMAEAVVGDDVYSEDPTVNVMCHCWGRGHDIIAGDLSHISCYEQGGAAQVSEGLFCLENTHNLCGGRVLSLAYLQQVSEGLFCLKFTHNHLYGFNQNLPFSCYPNIKHSLNMFVAVEGMMPCAVVQAYELTQRLNIKLHLDGARLMNAAVYLKVPAATITQYCDSVSVCLSKQPRCVDSESWCPVWQSTSGNYRLHPKVVSEMCGHIVCDSAAGMSRARKCRKVLGGGMRQSGILAAAGLYSLRYLVARLSQDHLHAHQLALASKQLRILQCNINGLCSTATKIKLEEIMEIAEKQKIQIIALQETKLNEKYNLKYKNYNILRKDRNKEGGGLAFLIKNLYYEDIAINIPNTSDLEAQGIKVYLSQNKTINIFNMYHPPNNKLIDDGTMAQFLTDNTIIVGDLNAKHQLWGCSMPNPRGKILSNLFDDNAFMCLNDGNPTHHSYSYNTAQALDISFSSPDIFHKCKWQILKSIGSDHLPILIEISTKTKTSSIKEKFWNFKKANWNLYQQNTNEDFRKAPTRIKDLEQNWISFKNTIIKAAKVSIPRGNIKKWIPNYTHQAKDIQTLITKRNELQKKCTQNQTNCRTELNIVNAKIKSTHNIFHEKINMKELDYALENTDLNKTPGPDGIHGQMISNLGKNGKERLLDIFNNSWKTGKLPQDWKTATIIPIKKLDKSADDPKNYRPISLTSICCKLMEKIILRRLTYHLDTKNLLPEEQYGFRKGHGTIDQLLFFTQKVPKDEEDALGEKIQIKGSSRNESLLRLVLHLDISQQDVQRACRKLNYVLTHHC
ncbi:Tha1 [Cordylochernes scorpioides]|uniref:Tha1 n=1 Tax=Cordylochernes scorpioides TaxID=51811 RepID=A0ABY6K5G4_9ARAC|nr:Tha1 [Cordylochernes scorpioides]